MAEGSSVGNVTRASEQADYSHFISLPLAVHPGLVEKLQNFQNSILGNLDSSQDLGIDKSIFINPKTFHLTVLMLKLWNEERVATAAEVLQKVSPKVMKALKDRPISIRLKGLDCMRGSVSEACVLYTPVEEIGGEGRLMRACQVIIDAYVKAGLVLQKDACQKLKLHGTVMNVKFRKRYFYVFSSVYCHFGKLYRGSLLWYMVHSWTIHRSFTKTDGRDQLKATYDGHI